MRRTFIIITLLITSGIYVKTQAEIKTNMEDKKNGEQIFIEHSDKCLAIIEKAAQKLSIEGVAMIAFIPGDVSGSWISKMKVVGSLANDKANFLAIAYAKAAEMAVTLKDSGNGERKDITGEFGWQGGMIVKVDSGYLMAAFSGGSSQEDLEAAKEGLDWLSGKYPKR